MTWKVNKIMINKILRDEIKMKVSIKRIKKTNNNKKHKDQIWYKKNKLNIEGCNWNDILIKRII